MRKAKTTFTITTPAYDAGGEPVSREIDAKFIDLMYRWTHIDAAIGALSYFVIREINVDKNENGPYRIAYLELCKIQEPLIDQLRDCGVFDSKYDFRTAWNINERTILKKFMKVEQVAPCA